MEKSLLLFIALLGAVVLYAQPISISVDVLQNRKTVSPYIFGKNNSLSDDPSSPLSVSEWQRLRDAGIMLFRENSGNNATKYNWRLKLTSAPDWYNNVYGANWDFEAQSLQTNIPGAKAMYAFQLIGKAAASAAHNFDDWNYNGAQWWPGVNQNLAGGGVVNTNWNATEALVEGNTNLYLKNWPADSTVAILDKWFGTGTGQLNLNPTQFQYWNLDNEPEIWYSTHDDVMPTQLPAEEFMQRYFEVATKARAKSPNIKLVGFVPCSEWFWFAWTREASNKISYKGSEYTWIEYFIKRIGERQDSTGVRLLDVIDLHTYLSATTVDELLQVHRVFYDTTFVYPGANGIKLLSPDGWDDTINKEYIFKRINDWLTQYIGADHGVTLGSTESGWENFNQMPLALNYASTLGVFANEGVELFTPWFWSPSYWEVVHLFSKYGKPVSVKSTSSDDNTLSAYSTVSVDNDSLTIILVNRNAAAKNTHIALSNFSIANGAYPTLTLSNLPADNSTETFVSHSTNALASSSVVAAANALNLTLPAYSITAIILKSGATGGDYLGVSPSSLEIGSETVVDTLTVLSNVAWSANSNQPWLTLNPTSGTNNDTIVITARPNRQAATRNATITVTGAGVTEQTITLTQAAPTIYANEELVIYNDSETLIEATWAQNGTLSQITTGASEGTTHYRFNYSYSNWWAGFGLNLTNFGGNGTGYNFTGYESLKFASKITGPATATVLLVDANASTSSDDISIEGIGSTYKEFTIPLSSFTGLSLDDVGEIMVNINGNSSSGSGTFNIDNIRLGVKDVPPYKLAITDTVLGSSISGCFDAIDTITVAGDGNPVTFTSGSSTTLIAEQSILFLPGFHALEGSIMNASITTNRSFCNGPLSAPIIDQHFEKTVLHGFNRQSNPTKSDESLKVYPNPSDGLIRVELKNVENGSFIRVFDLYGRMVYQTKEKVVDGCSIDLSGLTKGIYVVKFAGLKKEVLKKITVM
jgi:hypothetical protein